MGEIRDFSRADAATVAVLFQKTFRASGGAAPRSLEAYLVGAYLEHPWFDPEIAPRVHVDDGGRVTGFIGVFPGRFDYRDKQYRGAVAGTLMVEDPAKEPLAGAKLLRAVVKGPQDFTVSETTNLISQRLWEPLGGKVVPLLSLDWFRVFSPAGAAFATLAEKFPPAAWLAPAARAGDRIALSITKSPLRPVEPSGRLTVSTEVSDPEFTVAVLELSRSYEMRPAWTPADLEWLLAHAARKERHGSLRRAIVRSRKGDIVGCYIYHAAPRGMARVLQVLSVPSATGDVLDCLFSEVARAGLSGVRGRASPQLIDALLIRNCVFLHRASTVIHTKDRELAEAIEGGGALVNGLAGEVWTRLIGGIFD